jgi:FkbM family methyltransferase
MTVELDSIVAPEVYEFGNGVRLHRAHLLALQLQRYAAEGNPNLHEPVEEECMLQAFAAGMPARPVFLDIGAAVGYYAILIKQRWPAARVIAVDPLAHHLAALRDNTRLNGLPADAIEILEMAVGTLTGFADFVDAGYGSSLADAALAPKGRGLPVLQVRTLPLAALLADCAPVHLMKMDIQGAELEVLAAAQDALAAGQVQHAMIGTHSRTLHEQVRSLLRGCGFTIVHDDPAPPMQPDGILLATHTR